MLRALADALTTIPARPDRAWDRVLRQLREGVRAEVRPLGRWPLAASLSVVTAFLALSQFGLIGAWAQPTLAAGFVPTPHASVETPAVGLTAERGATSAPFRVHTPTPIPPPPAEG
jgi:hypothetical protein